MTPTKLKQPLFLLLWFYLAALLACSSNQQSNGSQKARTTTSRSIDLCADSYQLTGSSNKDDESSEDDQDSEDQSNGSYSYSACADDEDEEEEDEEEDDDDKGDKEQPTPARQSQNGSNTSSGSGDDGNNTGGGTGGSKEQAGNENGDIDPSSACPNPLEKRNGDGECKPTAASCYADGQKSLNLTDLTCQACESPKKNLAGLCEDTPAHCQTISDQYGMHKGSCQVCSVVDKAAVEGVCEDTWRSCLNRGLVLNPDGECIMSEPSCNAQGMTLKEKTGYMCQDLTKQAPANSTAGLDWHQVVSHPVSDGPPSGQNTCILAGKECTMTKESCATHAGGASWSDSEKRCMVNKQTCEALDLAFSEEAMVCIPNGEFCQTNLGMLYSDGEKCVDSIEYPNAEICELNNLIYSKSANRCSRPNQVVCQEAGYYGFYDPNEHSPEYDPADWQSAKPMCVPYFDVTVTLVSVTLLDNHCVRRDSYDVDYDIALAGGVGAYALPFIPTNDTLDLEFNKEDNLMSHSLNMPFVMHKVPITDWSNLKDNGPIVRVSAKGKGSGNPAVTLNGNVIENCGLKTLAQFTKDESGCPWGSRFNSDSKKAAEAAKWQRPTEVGQVVSGSYPPVISYKGMRLYDNDQTASHIINPLSSIEGLDRPEESCKLELNVNWEVKIHKPEAQEDTSAN